MKKWIYLLLLITPLFFQNCAGNFQVERRPQSVSESLSVFRMSVSSQSNPIVEVQARSELIQQAESVLWDHIFEEDLTYCEQTTSVDKITTTFMCPKPGWLTVFLYLEFSDGSQSTERLKVYVNADENQSGGESLENLSGAELYQVHCAGCHSALATSTKRGITMSRLDSGLSTVSQMSALKGMLSNSEKQAIVNALQ